MNKKGFLYTLGLSLFLIAVLSLGILFLRQAALERERNTESGFSLKVWDEHTSINKAVADVFINTGIFLNSTNLTATFEEPLPHNFTSFDQFMKVFIDRIEGNFTDVNISLDRFYQFRHEVCFRPMNISYQHQGPSDKLDQIVEIDVNSKINSFNITLKFKNPVTCTEVSKTFGPKLNAKITVSPTADGSCDAYATPTNYNALTLTFTNTTGSQANLQIKTPGGSDKGCFYQTGGSGGGAKMLSLNSKYGADGLYLSMESTIVIGYLNSPPEKGYFETGIELTINNTAFNFYKRNNVLFLLPLQN